MEKTKKYKITYNIQNALSLTTEIKAESQKDAMVIFYLAHGNATEVLSIEEVD